MLSKIVDASGVPVLCYGLKTDSQTRLFPGSKRLLEIADSISEIKTVCECGKKAVFNVKTDESEDDITGSYVSVCRRCWKLYYRH